MIDSATPIKIRLSGNVQSGWARFELRQPDGLVVWDSGQIGPGNFGIKAQYDLSPAVTGTYTLGLVYGDSTALDYNLGWHALKLDPIVLLPGVGMLLVCLGYVAFAVYRKILSWRWFWMGALFWTLTVSMKFAFAIPVNSFIFSALGASVDHPFILPNLIASVYVGSLTGIFEAGVAWLVLRKIRWGKATWSQALVFGIGFGVIEALLIGLGSFATTLAAMLAPDALPIYTLGSLANNANWIFGFAPVLERMMVILAHIFSCVLIFYAIARGQSRWGWLSILYKTLLDTPAGFAAFWGVQDPFKLWTIEAVISVFGLVALWGIFSISRKYPRPQEPSTLSTQVMDDVISG